MQRVHCRELSLSVRKRELNKKEDVVRPERVRLEGRKEFLLKGEAPFARGGHEALE